MHYAAVQAHGYVVSRQLEVLIIHLPFAIQIGTRVGIVEGDTVLGRILHGLIERALALLHGVATYGVHLRAVGLHLEHSSRLQHAQNVVGRIAVQHAVNGQLAMPTQRIGRRDSIASGAATYCVTRRDSIASGLATQCVGGRNSIGYTVGTGSLLLDVVVRRRNNSISKHTYHACYYDCGQYLRLQILRQSLRTQRYYFLLENRLI